MPAIPLTSSSTSTDTSATPGRRHYQFYPLTPCRVIDTRNADGARRPAAGRRLRSATSTSQNSTCIPQGRPIEAYAFNVTVVAYPGGQPLGLPDSVAGGSRRSRRFRR